MSSDADVIIRARHIAKAYRLFDNRNDRMKQALLGSFKTYYKSFWALKDVSFDIRRGDSVGILGRNGSGKSTLLQIVCGIARPTGGELWVNGRIAPVFALGATFDLEATGRENVLIGGSVLGLQRTEIIQKLDSIADFAGIGDFMDQSIKRYSVGMRSRLAFAICAHVEPEILIVDEALAVGDPAFQQKCLTWIDSFRADGTLLFVSHSTDDVIRLCRHAIWIDKGRVREVGEPAAVVQSYEHAMKVEPDTMDRFSAI